MTSRQRRYVIAETAVSMMINGLISFAFALGVSHGLARLPLWGTRGIAVDFVPQVFMITLATASVATLLLRKRLRAGQVEPLVPPNVLGLAPRTIVVRALLFAVIAVITVAPLSVAAMWATGVTSLPTPAFIAFKVVYGVLLSTIVAPVVVIAALSTPSITAGR